MTYPFTNASIEAALLAEGVRFYSVSDYSVGMMDECGILVGLSKETSPLEDGWGDFRICLLDGLQTAMVYDGRGNTDEDSYGPLLGSTDTAAGVAALIRAAMDKV